MAKVSVVGTLKRQKMAKVSTKKTVDEMLIQASSIARAYITATPPFLDLSFQKTTFYNGECYCSRQ